jgi:hypothetical protein
MASDLPRPHLVLLSGPTGVAGPDRVRAAGTTCAGTVGDRALAIAIFLAGAAPWAAGALGVPAAPFDQAVGAMAALAGAGALLSDLGGARRRRPGIVRP